MAPEFAIVYDLNGAQEVRVFANTLEDAMASARFLSANSDIRFSSLHLVTRIDESKQPEHSFLCQFQHGRIHRLQPLAEQLIQRARLIKGGADLSTGNSGDGCDAAGAGI